MKSMGSAGGPLFPRGPGLGLKALLLATLSLLAMLADERSRLLVPVRDGMAWTLQPVLWVAALPQTLAESAQLLRGRGGLIAENEALKEKQLLLDAQLQKMAALESENARIRELLESARQLEEKVLIAEVLSAAQDPYRHQIVLNKGTRDGVYRGQALVDAHGVLGQVVKVHPNSSIALLITDPNHGIPVEVNRTGLQTIALGRGDGQSLSLPYLPGNADVKVGDLLVSSPLGGRFPAGYPVGQVHELRHSPGEHFMEAIAYPTARLNQGRQALLVWSESYPVAEPAGRAPAAGSAERQR